MTSDRAPADLPPISRAVLTREEVEALFRDVRALAQIECISIRLPHSRTGVAGATIDDAERDLLSSAATAVQLRYAHNGAAWFDTIKTAAGGFELVRMQQTAENDQASLLRDAQ